MQPTAMQEVYKITGVDPKTDPVLSMPVNEATYSAIAGRNVELMCLALNGDWVANMADTSQRKYFPIFNVIPDSSRPSGFRLSYSDYDYDISSARLGSRHYLKDVPTVEHAVKYFMAQYEAIYSTTYLLVWERVNTFSDVCRELGVNEAEVTITDDMSPRKKRGIQAERLQMLEEVFNGGTDMNYADTDQRKYNIWVNIIRDEDSPSGFRLSFMACDYVSSNVRLGSRHAFVSVETARKVFEKFQQEYINSFRY